MKDNKLMTKVFGWMFLGLMCTFLTGYLISQNEFTVAKLLTGYTPFILAIIEIALVIFLSTRIYKMQPITAKVTFLAYSIVTGITFSCLFLYYEMASIIYVFLMTAILFAVFAAIGYFTKLDLTKIGTYLFIGLIGALICGIVNIFLNNSAFDMLISIVFVVVFVGMTAYDVQKIKQLSTSGMIEEDNVAIYGALSLYLDFINLFIELLKIFGKRDD